jgi:transposase
MSVQHSDPLFTDQAALKLEYEGLKNLVARSEEKLAQSEEENERLREIILEMQRQRFGPRKERWESEEQACLFNEAEAESKKPEGEGANEDLQDVEVKGFTRKRGKRRPLPENLPREVIVLDLPEEEKLAEDGTPLRVIGKEVSEKLFYEPPQIKVIEYHRLRYGVDSGDTGKIAPPIPSIIPKGMATPSLLAQIVTSKYVDGLPLYRQENIFDRLNIDLSRGTMARWIIQAAEACQPVWNILEERLMESPYVSCDETWTQVLKEKGRKAESQSWMWVRATPTADQKIVLFDYDPHRSGEVAKRLFTEYRGSVQVDGYSAYNVLEKQEGIDRLGCNMHGRRRFYVAWKTGSKNGQSLAAEALRYYKKLYDLEEQAKEKALSWDERDQLRQKESVPIWEEFKTWAEKNQPKVPPKSKLGEALHYFLGEYPYLIGYLKDGRFEMDNGFVERAIKCFAIGRNNWLFSDTEDGARASSLLYSLAVTAHLNDVNPYTAFKVLFTEIPKSKTIENYERLAAFILTGTLTPEK